MVTVPPRLGVPMPTPGPTRRVGAGWSCYRTPASSVGRPTPASPMAAAVVAPRARNARRSYRSAESAIGPPRPGWTRSPLAPLARHGRRHAAERPGTLVRGGARVVRRARAVLAGCAASRRLPGWARDPSLACGHAGLVATPSGTRPGGPSARNDNLVTAGGSRDAAPRCRRRSTGSPRRASVGATVRALRSASGQGDAVVGAPHRGRALGGGASRGGGRARRRARVREPGQALRRRWRPRVHEGLLGWDAGWYETIARHGYAGAGHLSLRFFPLVPVLTRASVSCPRHRVRCRAGGGGQRVGLRGRGAPGRAGAARDRRRRARPARRVAAVPGAGGLHPGDGIRRRDAPGAEHRDRARPAGPGVVVGRRCSASRPAPRGPSACCWWCPPSSRRCADCAARRRRRGRAPWRAPPRWSAPWSASAPFSAGSGGATATRWPRSGCSNRGTLRGGVADPLRTLAHDASLLVHGRHLGSALHLPWALLAVALLVVTLRRWPRRLRGLRRGGPDRGAHRRRTSTGSSATPCRPSRWCWRAPRLTSGPRVERAVLSPGRGRAWPSTPCSPSPTCTSRDAARPAMAAVP